MVENWIEIEYITHLNRNTQALMNILNNKIQINGWLMMLIVFFLNVWILNFKIVFWTNTRV